MAEDTTRNALQRDIAAFEAQRADLFKHHAGKFVVFFEGQFRGAYDTFQNAANEAVEKFGKGPYLIRQVTDEGKVVTMPISVLFRPRRAAA